MFGRNLWILFSIALSSTLACLGGIFCHLFALLFLFHPSMPLYLDQVTASIFAKATQLLIYLCAIWNIEVINEPKTPLPNNTIVICNHASNADGFLLLNVVNSWIKMVFKSSLAYIPIFGQSFTLTRQIPIRFNYKDNKWKADTDSVAHALERCRQLCQRNVAPIIFAEGTRSYKMELNAFKPGFFKFAVENQSTILPMAILGSIRAWPKGHYFPKPANILIVYGEPISSQGHTTESLSETVRNQIGKMVSEHMNDYWRDTTPEPEAASTHLSNSPTSVYSQIF